MMYTTARELLESIKTQGKSIIEIVIEKEMRLTGLTALEFYNRLWKHFEVMRAAAYKALTQPQRTQGDMISGDAKRMNDYVEENYTISGGIISRAMALALSSSEVNASMGKICAIPTAGSCGIVPAALISMMEAFHYSDTEILNALLVCGVVGEFVTRNATVAGAEGGCQAECGTAAAMAAAGAVWLRCRDAEVCFHAAAIALQNVMGLVCDPIAGLVEAPCAKRNASGVVNALSSADMALAGVRSVIPFDEVVSAMYKVGRQLPGTLKETAMGGVAVTPTGLEIRRRILGNEE